MTKCFWAGISVRVPLIFAVQFLLAVVLCSGSYAQDADTRPARASEAAEALKAVSWREISKGLHVLQASTALGTRLTAFKISRKNHFYSIEQQASPKGERANSVLQRLKAKIVVNGGFFGMRSNENLYPVGELIDDGARVSAPWMRQGGYLAIDGEGNTSIVVTGDVLPDTIREAVQSRPVLIEPGKKWAMRTNGNEPERRTLFCRLNDDEDILMLVSGGGLTLFEAGWLFRADGWGGVFDCESAIALDGGGSTQLSVDDHRELNISGITPVQNLLVISER